VGAHRWWGWVFQIAYLGFLAAVFWTTFSRSEYEKARALHPDLTRGGFMILWALLFVALPLLVWLLFVLPRILPGR